MLGILTRVMRFTLVLILPVMVSSALRGGKATTITADVPAPPRFQIPCPGPFYSADTTEIIECQSDPNKFVLESLQGYYCCFMGTPSVHTQQQRLQQQPPPPLLQPPQAIPVTHPTLSWTPVKNAIYGRGQDDRLGYGLENGNGIVLSGDGRTMAVASRYNDGRFHDAGHVRVLRETPFGWDQVGQEIHGYHGGSHAGWSVDLNHDGTVVAIGSIRHAGDKGNYQGLVRVLKLVEGFPMGQWKQIGEDLTGDDLFDYFGFSTSLSHDGSIVAVGAIQHVGAEGKRYGGYVKVHRFSNGIWNPVGSKIHGERDGSKFGNSISMSSNGLVLAVGASHHTGSSEEQGMVKVFHFQDNDWAQVGEEIEGEPTSKSGTAISLAGDGMTVAIGSPSHNHERGHTRVYRYREGKWIKVGQDLVGESKADGAGSSVALSGNGATLVVGTHQPHSTGHVKVLRYDYESSEWLLVSNIMEGSGVSENYGSSVTVSEDGTRVAVSAPFARAGEYTQAGVVKVYDLK